MLLFISLWACRSARKDGAADRLVRARGGGFRPVVTVRRLEIRDGGGGFLRRVTFEELKAM